MFNKANISFSKYFYFIIIIVVVFNLYLYKKEVEDSYYKNNIMYTSGLAVNFTYLIAIITILVIVINSIVNIKKLGNKKYIPMFIFLLFGGIALFLQIKYPELFLISPLEVLVTVVMYFTIENPDVKIPSYKTTTRQEYLQFLEKYNDEGELKVKRGSLSDKLERSKRQAKLRVRVRAKE